MSLLVKEVDLRNFRNVRAREISLGEGMNVLVGRNATGKTNTVEALQLLTTGTSFRHPRPAELLREGEVTGRASARLEGDGRVVDVELDLTPERK